MHIPPYVWIHIKNFMLQDYWNRKKRSILDDLPKSDVDTFPHAVLTTAAKATRFKKEFERNPFNERITTVYSIYRQ